MTGSACQGSGGSSSSSWGSGLVAPSDSTITNVWESYGDSWGISWQCNAIDF